MAHIKSKIETYYYIINAEGDLTQHPAILNYGHFWELSEGTPPENAIPFMFQEE
jgi:hypothetical protein